MLRLRRGASQSYLLANQMKWSCSLREHHLYIPCTSSHHHDNAIFNAERPRRIAGLGRSFHHHGNAIFPITTVFWLPLRTGYYCASHEQRIAQYGEGEASLAWLGMPTSSWVRTATGANSCRNLPMKYGFLAPPPPTITWSTGPLGKMKLAVRVHNCAYGKLGCCGDDAGRIRVAHVHADMSALGMSGSRGVSSKRIDVRHTRDARTNCGHIRSEHTRPSHHLQYLLAHIALRTPRGRSTSGAACGRRVG
jgi:hypothetical protein